MKNLLLFIFATFLLSSCKNKGCTDPFALNYNPNSDKEDGSCLYPDNHFVSRITIDPIVYSTTVDFDTIIYAHPLGYYFSVATLKFFLSDIVLYKLGGDSIIIPGGFYFDCKEGPSSVNFSTQKIPDGQYTGIGFHFGLNQNNNNSGTYTNPPESLMEWPLPMGGGYHYMKFEGKYDSLGTIKNYNIHTGALNGTSYSIKIILNDLFTITDGDININLKMHLENWLQQPNDFDFNVYGAAIMGNPTAQTAIMENGYNVFSIVDIY